MVVYLSSQWSWEFLHNVRGQWMRRFRMVDMCKGIQKMIDFKAQVLPSPSDCTWLESTIKEWIFYISFNPFTYSCILIYFYSFSFLLSHFFLSLFFLPLHAFISTWHTFLAYIFYFSQTLSSFFLSLSLSLFLFFSTPFLRIVPLKHRSKITRGTSTSLRTPSRGQGGAGRPAGRPGTFQARFRLIFLLPPPCLLPKLCSV